jgi:hypothetical protein
VTNRYYSASLAVSPSHLSEHLYEYFKQNDKLPPVATPLYLSFCLYCIYDIFSDPAALPKPMGMEVFGRVEGAGGG